MNTWLAHHGIPGMKWGVRNGPPYPLNSKTLSKEIYNNAKKHEPEITKDISEAFSIAGAKAYGLEHKLKTRESIQRKIDTDAEEKGVSISDAASGIKDAVRYTALSDDNNFVNAYQTIKKNLTDKGYEEVRCRNYFDEYRQGKVKHKSVQSVFKTPDGYSFEVQFQTPSSQKAKDKKVPLYEERRNPKVSPERAKELEQLMVELAEGVSDPKDIYTIKSHNGHIAHHGIKGQRWGVRRFQNYDGTKIKDPRTSDYTIKKGHILERVYTETNNYDPNSYKNKRLYVSDEAGDYLNDYFVNDPEKIVVQRYKTVKKMLIAGEEATNKILKEIGQKPLTSLRYYDDPAAGDIGTNRDFLFSNKEIGEKFIKRALEKGYSGIRDPIDDTGEGFSYTAKILFDFGPESLEKIKKMGFYDYV